MKASIIAIPFWPIHTNSVAIFINDFYLQDVSLCEV